MTLKFFTKHQKSSEPKAKQALNDKQAPTTKTEADEQGALAAPEAETAGTQGSKKKTGNRHPYRWMIKLGKLMVKVGMLLLIGFALWMWVGNIHITHDNNMYPHIKDGDLVVTYKLQPYIIGDAVLYETSSGKHIGRIIAKAGDVVQITEDGFYTINDVMPYENVFYDTRPAEKNGIEFPYTVPEGYMFLMNDMREMTSDSRKTGAVAIDAMCGKVVMIVRHRGV